MIICPACARDQFKRFAELATPYLDRREHYTILVCQACGHGQAVGRDDDAYLSKIYSDKFHDTSQQVIRNGQSPIERNAEERTAWLVEMGVRGKLLDVGAGKGAFVKAAGTAFAASGIELSESAVAAARLTGADVVAGDFMALEMARTHYDVITFWDVMAGLRDPAGALERAARSLHDNGIIVASLPMIDSRMARLLKRYWPLLIPPVNLQYFSRNSIALMAKRHGLVLDQLLYRPKEIAIAFLAAKAARSLGLFDLGNSLARMPSWSMQIDLGDIAYAVLRQKRGVA